MIYENKLEKKKKNPTFIYRLNKTDAQMHAESWSPADVLTFWKITASCYAKSVSSWQEIHVMYKHRKERYPPSRLTPSRKVIRQIYRNVKLHFSSQPLTDRCWCRSWQPWHPNETNIQFSKWIVLQRCQKGIQRMTLRLKLKDSCRNAEEFCMWRQLPWPENDLLQGTGPFLHL